MSEKRLASLYYSFQLFFGLLLWVPVFYQVQKQSGLTDPQIFQIQSIYYLVFCFLELPTGLFADKFGFRRSMIAGGATLVAANVLPIVEANFLTFLSHFCLIALARSFVSGASSAYLYEYLRRKNRTGDYAKIEGNARFYSLIAKIVLWAFSGYMVLINPMIPYALTAVSAAIAFGVAIMLPDITSRIDVTAASAATKGGLRAAMLMLRDSPRLFIIMLQGVGIFVLVRLMEVNIFQPILSAKHFSVVHFGWILSAMTAFEAIASRSAYRFTKRFSHLSIVWATTLILCACLIVIPFVGQIGTPVALMIFAATAGLAFPVQKQLLNDQIQNSHLRATVLSLESLIDRAVCSVAVLPVGGFVATGRIDDLLWIFAGTTAVLVTFTYTLARR